MKGKRIIIEEASGEGCTGGKFNCTKTKFDSEDPECQECEKDAMDALNEAYQRG